VQQTAFDWMAHNLSLVRQTVHMGSYIESLWQYFRRQLAELVPAHKGPYRAYTLNTGLKATVHMEKYWDMYLLHRWYTSFVA
jgi:hypothetical protein